jgi:hypothetical protein
MMPVESLNQSGPSIPKAPITAFTAPDAVNKNWNTMTIATVLVTDGK